MTRLILSSALAAAAIGGGLQASVRPASAPAGDVTVSVDWLSHHLDDRGLVILQVSRREEYDKEHVANARLIDPRSSANLEAAQATGPQMDMNALPSEAELRGKLEHLGVSDGSHVIVVFGEPGVVMATRTIFLLRYAGVDNVSLLDGGLAAWKRGGHPVTATVPTVAPGHFAGHLEPGIAVDYAYVQSHLHSPHIRIVDAREPVYYHAASSSMGMAPGHIPGAKNIPFNSLFDDAGLLHSTAVLDASFRSAGIQPGDTVVAYCHVGLQATAVLLGARALGIPARLYVGSFHDWGAHNLPTEGGTP